MASASVIFTKLADTSADFMSQYFVSQTVASGGASTACPPDYNFAMITAITADVWIALTFDGSVPNTANAAARIPVIYTAGPTWIMIPKGTRIGVLDMP
jgi:hypothetical protein